MLSPKTSQDIEKPFPDSETSHKCPPVHLNLKVGHFGANRWDTYACYSLRDSLNCFDSVYLILI